MTRRRNESLIPRVPKVVKRAVDEASAADRQLQEIVRIQVADDVRLRAVADFALSELTVAGEPLPELRHFRRFIGIELGNRH